MKKYLFLFVYLFLFSFSAAQEQPILPQDDKCLSPLEEQILREKCEAKKEKEGDFLLPDECAKLGCRQKRAQDLQFAVQTELYNRAKANYFNYAALVPPKTEEEIAREKFITFLIWAGGCLGFLCICFVLFRLFKNKVSLRIKQRHGKHTLDDVFAAEKKD